MLPTVASPDWIAARGWVAPDRQGACFAAIPGTIAQLLTGESLRPPLPTKLTAGLRARYDRVVLVYFDALGFDLAERHSGHPLLARAADEGIFARITSQFPSTTTVHMPTIHSGLPVGEHSLYEWFVLEPSLDRLIAPLPFTYAGDGQPALLGDLEPAELYPATTLYEWLADRGASSVVAGAVGNATSPASGALLRGSSRQLGWLDVEEGLTRLADALSELPAPAYAFAYLESIDTLMHKVGPGQPQRSLLDDEVSHLLDLIEHALLDRLPAGTLLLLTADHGMTPVSPLETVYVNLGSGGAELAAHVRIGSDPHRHALAPAGSCRDLFLHAVPGHADDLVAALERRFGERAEVRRTTELLDGGLFGPDPSQRLRDRLADVVVLPVLGEAAYWYTPGRFRQALWGQHGGLTPQEMEIPLIAVHARA
jgi:hypothetical protein